MFRNKDPARDDPDNIEWKVLMVKSILQQPKSSFNLNN